MQDSHESAEGSSAVAIDYASISALIVDDEAHLRTYLRLALRELGINSVWETSDGTEAIDLYARHSPSIVFLDVNMPVKSGAETLEQLAALDPEVIAIMVTSESSHQTVRHFLDLGASGYVLKQRPPVEFRQALRELVGNIFASSDA